MLHFYLKIYWSLLIKYCCIHQCKSKKFPVRLGIPFTHLLSLWALPCPDKLDRFLIKEGDIETKWLNLSLNRQYYNVTTSEDVTYSFYPFLNSHYIHKYKFWHSDVLTLRIWDLCVLRKMFMSKINFLDEMSYCDLNITRTFCNSNLVSNLVFIIFMYD